MNQRQTAALASLERALGRVHDAGLVLCGMDTTLTAYPEKDFDRLAEDLPSAYEVQQALIEQDKHADINHHGAYRESGGW